MPLAGPPKETSILSLFRLNSKVAVATEGTRRIGREASKATAGTGADVASAYTSYPDRDVKSISDTLSQIVKIFQKDRYHYCERGDLQVYRLTKENNSTEIFTPPKQQSESFEVKAAEISFFPRVYPSPS